MSRIGKLPIIIPAGVKVSISPENIVTVKGQMGELSQQVDPRIVINVDGNIMKVERNSDEKVDRSLHGLTRALLFNMVKGVSEGYKIVQELIGVGYKASSNGQVLELALGYSHNIIMEMPPEIKVETLTERGKNTTITLKSHDKQLIGQVAAKIRSLRKPEPYKGKGIRFQGEEIKKKAGKSASA